MSDPHRADVSLHRFGNRSGYVRLAGNAAPTNPFVHWVHYGFVASAVFGHPRDDVSCRRGDAIAGLHGTCEFLEPAQRPPRQSEHDQARLPKQAALDRIRRKRMRDDWIELQGLGVAQSMQSFGAVANGKFGDRRIARQRARHCGEAGIQFVVFRNQTGDKRGIVLHGRIPARRDIGRIDLLHGLPERCKLEHDGLHANCDVRRVAKRSGGVRD
ncbi:MAG TPA: hypothetical protein VN599_01045 [Rudaea sp.]|nr:hypothetical protein [Rudaea sp.]